MPDPTPPAPTPDAAAMEGLTRREALLGAAAGAFALSALPNASSAAGAVLTAQQAGFDSATGRYTLPPLPYDYGALEPHIDEQTMRIHHDLHHAGYVRGLNRALDALANIRSGAGDAGLVKHWSRELAFHGSGHVNHALFWAGMAPPDAGGGGEPEGPLARAIARDFGSFNAFAQHFQAASRSVEGSGWGWLVYEPVGGKLLVMQAEKHQNLSIWGVAPLLGIDVWEHAYYLKYQNRRGEYVAAFMNVVNWAEINRRFQAAAG